MKNPTEEFVMLRMAEPLEEELRKEKNFKKQQAELWNVLLSWSNNSITTQKQIEDFSYIENTLSDYTRIYGEVAYRLGYSDGLKICMDQKRSSNKTFLSLEDMSNLISIYNAVKKLKLTLLGTLEISPQKDSIIGLLDCTFNIINHGVCAEIKLLGQDKSIELITNILDNNLNSPKEKAKQLLGISKDYK